MDAHEEDQARILEALENGYMVVDVRAGGRIRTELGEGRRLRQEWQQCKIMSCPALAITIGVIDFEDLSGIPWSLRSDEITAVFEMDARKRAAVRFLDDTLEAESSPTKWDEK